MTTQINPVTGNVMNPSEFVVTDPTLVLDVVTGFKVVLGQTKGGPYPLVSAVQDLSTLTVVGDVVTGTFAQLKELLAPGTWYGAAEAVNAAGASANSPEVAFDIVPPLPAAPTGFSVS